MEEKKNKMNISVTRLALQSLLERVKGATEKAGSMPVLRCVLLQVVGNQLHASATDLEVGIVSRIDLNSADIDSAGSVLVPASTLLEVVKRLPGAHVTLVDKGNHVQVISMDTDIKINTEDIDQFPGVVIGEPGQQLVTIDADIYHQAIIACEHAIASDVTKNNLNGIYFSLSGTRLTACATDGHRLALAGIDIEAENVNEQSYSHLISKKAVAEIKRLTDSRMQIYQDGNQVAFVQAATTLLVRLIDGQFPDYRRLIPSEQPGIITLAAKDLVSAVDRVRQVYIKKTSGITLEAQNHQLVVSSSSEAGYGRDTVPAELQGDQLTIGVSASYLTEAASAIGGDIVIKYGTGSGPLVILPQDYPFFDERLEVVMPMRI